jgi:hypothetical protein
MDRCAGNTVGGLWHITCSLPLYDSHQQNTRHISDREHSPAPDLFV